MEQMWAMPQMKKMLAIELLLLEQEPLSIYIALCGCEVWIILLFMLCCGFDPWFGGKILALHLIYFVDGRN